MKSVFTNLAKPLAVIPVLFLALAFSIPNVTSAACGGSSGSSPSVGSVCLENPLNNINSIDALLVAILNIIMVLMVPVIVFFIIYAGFKYVMAQGNASQVEEATRALTYAVIGGVLILGAVAISQIIQNVVRAF
jgi:Type IV secretion system pilin